MKNAKENDYNWLNMLLQHGEIDTEEYMGLIIDVGLPRIDLNDFDLMDSYRQPEQEPDTEPKYLDQPQEEPVFEQPEEHPNDLKPEEIGEYDPQFIGKNYKNTKYYY